MAFRERSPALEKSGTGSLEYQGALLRRGKSSEHRGAAAGESPARSMEGPPLAPASEARPNPVPGAQASADGTALDPVGGAAPAVQLPVLGQEPNVVTGTDRPSEGDVPVRQLRVPLHRFASGQLEEVENALAGNADHRGRPPATASTLYGSCGLWHTGQYTAPAAIGVWHRTHGLAIMFGATGGRGGGAAGVAAPPGGGTEDGAPGPAGAAAPPSAWGRVHPHFVQKSAPGSPRVPQWRQTLTPRAKYIP